MASKKKADTDDSFDDFDSDGDDTWDEDADKIEAPTPAAGLKLRTWRDIDRYKEERELRRLLNDDFLSDT